MGDPIDKGTEGGVEGDKAQDDLAARIAQAEAALRVKRDPFVLTQEALPAISYTRIGADFVGTVLGGSVMGWGIDSVLDTKPWGLLLLLFAGFVSGVWGIVRAFDRSGSKPQD